MENEKDTKEIEKVEDSKKGLTDQDKLSLVISFVCVLHVTLIILSFTESFPFKIFCGSMWLYYPPFLFLIINFVLFIKEKKNKKLNIITAIFFTFSSLFLIIALFFPSSFSEKLNNILGYNKIVHGVTGWLIVLSVFIFHPVMEIITFSKNIKNLKSIKILTRLFLFGFIVPIITIIFLSIPYKHQSLNDNCNKYKSVLFTYEITKIRTKNCWGTNTRNEGKTYFNLTNEIIDESW